MSRQLVASYRASEEILNELKKTAKENRTNSSNLIRRGIKLALAEIQNSKNKDRYS